MTTSQEQVFQSVRNRGYVDGWTKRELMARQVAKLQEELGEIASIALNDDSQLSRDILFTSEVAKIAFDKEGKAYWHSASGNLKIRSIPQLRKELADMQVVLFTLAEATVKYSGTEFDIVEAAEAKALADVERGVRE